MTAEQESGKPQWTFADEIAARLEKTKEAYDMLVAEFQKTLGRNPMQAMRRWSEEMVKRQTVYEFWATAQRLVSDDGGAMAVERHLAETEKEIYRYFEMGYLRPFCSAIYRVRVEAYLDLTEHYIPWLRRLLDTAPPTT